MNIHVTELFASKLFVFNIAFCLTFVFTSIAVFITIAQKHSIYALSIITFEFIRCTLRTFGEKKNNNRDKKHVRQNLYLIFTYFNFEKYNFFNFSLSKLSLDITYHNSFHPHFQHNFSLHCKRL